MISSLSSRFIQDPDEREDFLQEVFINAYQSLSQFRGESEFSTWLYQIARNQLAKRSKAESSISVDDHTVFDRLDLSALEKWKNIRRNVSQESHVIKEEISEKVRSLVSSLPIQYKNPIVLYYFENLSYKEIAEMLNLKMNTLKSYIFRGKELLRDLFHD
jgi:RNA polymerase sigma-70 factor (ECF subfamily)